MIGIKGRRIVNSGGSVPPVGLDVITVEVVFANTPVSPSFYFADMKYNKRAGMILVKDDGATDDNDVFAVCHGGITASNGNIYPGYRYTDGCGNPVEYHYTFAINDAIVRGDLNPGATTWENYKAMFPYNYRLSNHSYAHGGGAKGYDKYFQIRQNEISIYNNSGGLRTRTFVIPTADEGYSYLAPYLGYKLVGSTFGSESVADDNGNLVQYSSAIDVKTINKARINRFLFSRAFAANWNEEDLFGLKDLVNRVITDSLSGSKKVMGHMFSHQITDGNESLDTFVEFMKYIQEHPSNQDSMWIPNMSEFAEYYETKLNVGKTTVIEGNRMIITLDLSSLPKEMEYRDMSLVINGGLIQQVNIVGADSYSANYPTGLINVFNRNKNIKDPKSDVSLPQILTATASGNSIKLTYDRGITQTLFSNEVGKAYSVISNTVLSVTGNGTQWVINCQKPVQQGQTFDYRMQRGNASDNIGLKVPTYIGYPIS